jgi:hypothetical protein
VAALPSSSAAAHKAAGSTPVSVLPLSSVAEQMVKLGCVRGAASRLLAVGARKVPVVAEISVGIPILLGSS